MIEMIHVSGIALYNTGREDDNMKCTCSYFLYTKYYIIISIKYSKYDRIAGEYDGN